MTDPTALVRVLVLTDHSLVFDAVTRHLTGARHGAGAGGLRLAEGTVRGGFVRMTVCSLPVFAVDVHAEAEKVTGQLVAEFRPNEVFTVGVTGVHGPDVGPGDIVVGTHAVQATKLESPPFYRISDVLLSLARRLASTAWGPSDLMGQAPCEVHFDLIESDPDLRKRGVLDATLVDSGGVAAAWTELLRSDVRFLPVVAHSAANALPVAARNAAHFVVALARLFKPSDDGGSR